MKAATNHLQIDELMSALMGLRSTLIRFSVILICHYVFPLAAAELPSELRGSLKCGPDVSRSLGEYRSSSTFRRTSKSTFEAINDSFEIWRLELSDKKIVGRFARYPDGISNGRGNGKPGMFADIDTAWAGNFPVKFTFFPSNRIGVSRARECEVELINTQPIQATPPPQKTTSGAVSSIQNNVGAPLTTTNTGSPAAPINADSLQLPASSQMKETPQISINDKEITDRNRSSLAEAPRTESSKSITPSSSSLAPNSIEAEFRNPNIPIKEVSGRFIKAMCEAFEICKDYSNERLTCASAGDLMTCLSIKLTPPRYEKAKRYCKNDGTLNIPEKDMPSSSECALAIFR